MSHQRLPPPEPASCLVRPYPSSQKGGTLIAEDVTDRDEHRRRLCDPDGYRPRECFRCHHAVLHVHDHPARVLAADSLEPATGIVRYRCAACEAVWRILPAFVARHLWRSWDTVKRRPRSPRCPSARCSDGAHACGRGRSRWCSCSPPALPSCSCASRSPSDTRAAAKTSCMPMSPMGQSERAIRSPPWRLISIDSCRGSVSCSRRDLRARWDSRGEKCRSHREWR
jgi:hypothetical protein